MIVTGLGTDIIEIKRVADMYRRNPRFAERIYTRRELKYCLAHQNCFPHLAARFAAKEAVAKALGRSFSWQDVEIDNEDSGRPGVLLYGEARKCAENKKVMLSISHSHDYATAVALILEE
jgi:holo-[acyl-carrier protein] synthase